MEVFYPSNNTVRTVITELPQEVGHVGGLMGATMLPIDNGRKFVIYGGYVTFSENSIYEYSLGSPQWTKGNFVNICSLHQTHPNILRTNPINFHCCTKFLRWVTAKQCSCFSHCRLGFESPHAQKKMMNLVLSF